MVMPFPGGNPEIREIPTWRFRDRDGKWRVSLAPEFVALEATSYSSRNDFLGRLRYRDPKVSKLPLIRRRLSASAFVTLTASAASGLPMSQAFYVTRCLASPRPTSVLSPSTS